MTKEFDLAKYSKLFVSETRESLRTSNDAMLQLEKDPDNMELLDQIFRSCHTIKGMAGMMNLKDIVETAHAMEDVLKVVREGRLKPTGRVAELMFKGFDALDAMVTAVEKSLPVEEDRRLIKQLKDLIEEAEPAREKKKLVTEKPVEKAAAGTTTVRIKLGRRCALPAARSMVILKELRKAASIISHTPDEEDIERERVFDEFTVVLEPGHRFTEALNRVVAMTDVEEVFVGSSSQPKERWKRMARQELVPAAAVAEMPQVQTVKVGMDKLDNLLDDVGELVIGRSRLMEKTASREDLELQEISALIDKLTSEIQSKVLGIRMIPLDMAMSRFPRMVRDISKAQGKEVELVVEGGGIELDRTVVDRISEPMVHILRNAVDHGIETVEERVRAGKREQGLIRIVASKQQDHVLIEVSDDGKGIDFDEIRKAAVARGIMTKQQADAALGRDLLDLLFKAGFSTKKEVTEVSGRGVGLDVVKKNVEDLGGSVMVSTSRGGGTTISLWLPFTLAIIEAMLVEINGQAYAVPMGTIVESHAYDNEEIRMIRGREVVQLRGEVLPLIRMRDFFGIEKGAGGTGINTLVVQSRDRRAALEVDELVGHQQIVVKSLDRRLRKVKGISGGTILGSGKIALILDVDSIIGG
ncbi:MAG: chemotaxis protein CheW [Thermoplasmata archaeon]